MEYSQFICAWEITAPRRPLTQSKKVRWANNLLLVVLDSLLLRFIFPLTAVAVATIAEQKGWGLINIFNLPKALAIPLAVVLMDLAIYLQHVMAHAVPLFWRLHRMHHTDLDLDVTSGSRFHPIEIILSMFVKQAVILVIGAPAVAVVIFEILLNLTAMFNHGNIRIPISLDRVLRFFVVTPDMHRIHHSVRENETNSNFGFNLPWWDRMLGTYLADPQDGQTGLTIGISSFRDSKFLLIHRLLLIPFLKADPGYVINRSDK